MSTYHGTQAKFAAKTTDAVAYTEADQVQSLSIDQESELMHIWELGGRQPVELKEGKITITGEVRRHFETGNFSATGKKLQELSQDATEVWCALFPEGDASPKILVSNCKFSSWHIEASIDGMVIESARYKGLAIAIS